MGYLHIAAVTPLRPYLFYLSSAVLFSVLSLPAERCCTHIRSSIALSIPDVLCTGGLSWLFCVHRLFPNGFGADLMHCFSVILRNAPLKMDGMRNFHCIRLPISIIRSLENP